MNIGEFMFDIGSKALDLGKKLYDAFYYQVNIKWIKTITDFFGADISLPDSISLSYILGGASAALIIFLIIYRLVK